MQEWYLGWDGRSVLFREVSSVQGYPYRRVPLYTFFEISFGFLFRLNRTTTRGLSMSTTRKCLSVSNLF